MTVEFEVATDALGAHEGKLDVAIGNEKFKIPIQIEVVARDAASLSLLILDDPFRFDELPAGIFAWHELVERNVLDVHYIYRTSGDFLRGVDLSRYDVVLIGDTATVMMSEQEVRSVREFTQRGGRLVLFSRPDRNQAPMHRLLKEMGLEVSKERVRLEPSNEPVFSVPIEELPADPLFNHVKSLRFEGHFLIRVVEPERASVTLSYPNRPDAAVLATARLGEGDAIAFGQDWWPVWFGEGVHQRFVGADNAQLIENLISLRDRPQHAADDPAIEADPK